MFSSFSFLYIILTSFSSSPFIFSRSLPSLSSQTFLLIPFIFQKRKGCSILLLCIFLFFLLSLFFPPVISSNRKKEKKAQKFPNFKLVKPFQEDCLLTWNDGSSSFLLLLSSFPFPPFPSPFLTISSLSHFRKFGVN